MIDALKPILRTKWIDWISFFVLAVCFVLYLIEVFDVFALKYADADELLMMYGAEEFSAGRFHMTRFFGQNYGSMLEAFVALPFQFLSLELAVSLSTCFLWLLPFVMIAITDTERKLQTSIFALSWLMCFPVEYAFLGTMPRDFVTGIAVTSLALLLINKSSRFSMILFGIFCLVGWSINQNAALFGATITIYKIVSTESRWQKTFFFISIGYLIGLLVHACVELSIYLHPEWIVHEAWPLGFNWKLIGDAFKNLDLLWGAVNPFGMRNSWIYIAIFALLLIWSAYRKKHASLASTTTLILILLASFCVPKVYDGFDSIFSPYERMYLAMPVAIFFLLSKARVQHFVHSLILLVLGVGLYFLRIDEVEQQATFRTSSDRGHIALYAKHEDVRNQLTYLNSLADSMDVSLILIGPDCFYLHSLAQTAHLNLAPDLRIIDPRYDRKTWFLREVDQQPYDRFLWLQTSIPLDSLRLATAASVSELHIENAPYKEEGYHFLFEGKDMNPLDIYRKAGFEVCNY